MTSKIVRTKTPGNAWGTSIEPDDGGGSQPVIDLGTFTAVEVATGGPKLLYTPDAGEIVYGGMIYDYVFTDQDRAIGVSTLSDMAAEVLANGGIATSFIGLLGYVDSDLSASMYAQPSNSDAVDVGPQNIFCFLTEPIVAVWLTGNSGIPVDSVPGAWQALHTYTLGQWIIDGEDHLQVVTQAGESDSTEPTWPASGGTVTTDGTVEWTDEGAIPTAGSMSLYAMRATPAAV